VLAAAVRGHRERHPDDPTDDWGVMAAFMARLADAGVVDRGADGQFSVGRLRARDAATARWLARDDLDGRIEILAWKRRD
jgi:hypothetical protein